MLTAGHALSGQNACGCGLIDRDAPLQIAVSLGIALCSINEKFLSSAELVWAVDDQLYKAKRAGRNRVRYLE